MSLTLVPHATVGGESGAEPDGLAYSLTLPAALSTPAIARAATRHILAAHHLPELADAAVQAVGELTATACQLTPAAQIYVSLRYRSGALRITVYDGEPHPAHPRLAAALDARRRAALRLLARVVKCCEGTWGCGESPEPGGGTRTWAVLPRATTAAYATTL
ncbi:ATP-binding protein [Streptomyces sp. N35]|uniref:ATP-binding protein n=1 Tax=Streptomyces sp. N35 TaxID=2795730 RepID=UPI0018F5FC12|nr:ATP-binding protein [Streptomyces sp. N35]